VVFGLARVNSWASFGWINFSMDRSVASLVISYKENG
jgi:hypothetical protein